MKKIMLVVAGIVLLMALSPSVALAGPPSPPDYGKYNPTDQLGQPPEEWGVEKVIPSPSAPGGAVRIITDPLEGTSSASGWVTFWCQSRLGFQYNIGATGLDPLSEYSVKAIGIQAHIVPAPIGPPPPDYAYIPPPEDFWIQIDNPVVLDLGTFKTDANGCGGVKGVEKLPSGYLYDVAVVVSDSDGAPVLWSPGDDTNGFIVY